MVLSPRRHLFLFLGILLMLVGNIALAAPPGAESLQRFREYIDWEYSNGNLNKEDFLPLIVVSVKPAFEESRTSYPASALATVVQLWGQASVRLCEACMVAEVQVAEGKLTQSTDALFFDDIAAHDTRIRGQAAPARAALWLDETEEGVAFRLVDLSTGRVMGAAHITPNLEFATRREATYTKLDDLKRRIRGVSISHAMFDLGMYPQPHLSFDWVEQWGDYNERLSGISFSLFEPVLGLGGSYYHVFPPLLNSMVGGKVFVSLPTALLQSLSPDSEEVFDDTVVVVGCVRVPISVGEGRYGIFAFISTQGAFGIGVSALNSSFLPIFP